MAGMAMNTTRQMKQQNIMSVIHALKLLASATKADIAQHTGLSLATCGTILNQLHDRGEILTASIDESRGGRPATRYCYNAGFFALLTLYIDGDDSAGTISYSLVSACGETLRQGGEEYSDFSLERMLRFIADRLADFPLIKAIGLGLPGVISGGRVVTCDISRLAGVPIAALLRARFEQFVQVGNDMNFTAYGFYRRHCPDVAHPVAYVFMPPHQCAGCGIVVKGSMLHGASRFAGEIAKLPGYVPEQQVGPDGRRGAGVRANLLQVVAALIAVLNPATIALAGVWLADLSLDDLTAELRKSFDSAHLPQFIYRASINDDYHHGLAVYTLDAYNHYRMR